MTTVKADAHFVDCDLATGPGGSWEAGVTGIPLFVGMIHAEGGAGRFYDEDYAPINPVVTVGSRSVVIHPEYAVFGGVVADSEDSCVDLYNYDRTHSGLSFPLGDGYKTSWHELKHVYASPDLEYIYAMMSLNLGGSIVSKFSIAGGYPLWTHWYATGGQNAMGMDASDDSLVATCINNAGNFPSAPALNPYHVIEVDPDTGLYVRTIGQMDSGAVFMLNGWRSSDDSWWEWTTNVKRKTPSGTQATSATLGVITNAIRYRGFIYVSGNTDGNGDNVWILDEDTLVTVGALPQIGSANQVWSCLIGYGGETFVCLAPDSGANPSNYSNFIYDLWNGSESEFASSLVKTEQSDFGSGASRSYASYSELYMAGYSPPEEATQFRTVAYPEKWDHLEGQEVQLLLDGTHLDDYTYVISGGVPVAQ